MEALERIKKLEEDRNKMQNDIASLKSDMRVNNYKTEQILNIVTKLEKSIEKLKEDTNNNKNILINDKAKNWDKIIYAVLSALGGAFLGFLLKQ